MDPDARARAFVDREENRLRLDTHGVARAVLALNDDLLDLDRPVTAVAGDREARTTVSRDLALALDLGVSGDVG